MTVLDDSLYILTTSHLIIRRIGGDILAPREQFVQTFMLDETMLDGAVYMICEDRIVSSIDNVESITNISDDKRRRIIETFDNITPGIIAWDLENGSKDTPVSTETITEEETWQKTQNEFSLKKILGF